MPCLLVFIALFTPRLVIVLLWFFTAWFRGLFNTALWPILGFVFLPTTFLWYTAVIHWYNGVWSADSDHRNRDRPDDRPVAGQPSRVPPPPDRRAREGNKSRPRKVWS